MFYEYLGRDNQRAKICVPAYLFYNYKWGTWQMFTFMWPCIVTNLFVIKPNRCTNFTNLFCHETLHVSDSSSIIRSLFTVHSAIVCVIQVCRQLSKSSVSSVSFHNTGRHPYAGVIRSKTYSGYAKPRIIPKAIYEYRYEYKVIFV